MTRMTPLLAQVATANEGERPVVASTVTPPGRVLEGTPWYVRLALLVTAGFGIFRLLSRKKRATPHGIWRPPDGWEAAPPRDRAV